MRRAAISVVIDGFPTKSNGMAIDPFKVYILSSSSVLYMGWLYMQPRLNIASQVIAHPIVSKQIRPRDRPPENG